MLAIPSVLIGFFTIGPMLFGDFFKGAITVITARHPAVEELEREYHGPLAMAVHAFTGPIFWLALAGVVLAWFFYMRRPDIPQAIAARFPFIYRLLENKYYFDWFNEHVLARATRDLGMGCGRAATAQSSTACSSTARRAASATSLSSPSAFRAATCTGTRWS